MELLYGWGNIIKIKVINYPEYSIAYIDFKYKDQADYFIRALHKTYFDNLFNNAGFLIKYSCNGKLLL